MSRKFVIIDVQVTVLTANNQSCDVIYVTAACNLHNKFWEEQSFHIQCSCSETVYIYSANALQIENISGLQRNIERPPSLRMPTWGKPFFYIALVWKYSSFRNNVVKYWRYTYHWRGEMSACDADKSREEYVSSNIFTRSNPM